MMSSVFFKCQKKKYVSYILIILCSLMVILLAVSTIIGQFKGSEFADNNIYKSHWFCCLWVALVIVSVVLIIKRKLWLRLPVFLLHVSFLIILMGAFMTFLFSKKGNIHLIKNKSVSEFINEENRQIEMLPFAVELDSFKISYYPGTSAPQNFISFFTIGKHSHRVSMNNIFVKDGYRFYQSSFDDDMNGSWLSVNYDPLGIGITYTGYVLLGISMIGILFSKRETFRKLLGHKSISRRIGMIIILTCMCLGNIYAQKIPVITRKQADSLSVKQVIYNDRIVPFNTLAIDFVKKLTGNDRFSDITAEQVVTGWLIYPEEWKSVPMILIKSRELRELLGIKKKYASLSQLFDGNEYRLQKYWSNNDYSDKVNSNLKKAIQETDERVGVILMLRKGTLFHELPDDGSVARLSDIRVKAELLYNSVPFTKILFMLSLTLGILSFIMMIFQKSYLLFDIMLFVTFLLQLSSYILRWYIADRIPLSNGYETMQFMALFILAITLMLHRRFSFILPFGFLLAGFSLLVSHLGQMNPQITNLMPVLVSPLLSIHVSIIMMSYSLMAFMMLNSIYAVILIRRKEKNEDKIEQLTVLNKLMLYLAVFFIGAGIFLGAVWANISWGRYWGWDPKEVWALITFIIYSAPFHGNTIPAFKNPKSLHIYLIIVFISVLMTYFGVNLVLGGMHSYAS